jgi:hypothetical protein
MKNISDIPIGAQVRTTRRDGSTQEGVFVGFDSEGLIFQAPSGEQRRDIGPWVHVDVNTGSGWIRLPK